MPHLDLVLSQHEHAQSRHRVHARDAKDLVVVEVEEDQIGKAEQMFD